MVKRVVDQLVDKGKVVRGWLGVALQPLSPELAQTWADGTNGAVVGIHDRRAARPRRPGSSRAT